jgi:hypothetical protein
MEDRSLTRARGAGRGLGERILFKSLVAVAVLWPLIVILAPKGYGIERFYDAGIYHRAGQAYLAGTSLYASLEFRQWPVVGALFAPIAPLPPRVATILISTLSMSAGLAGLHFLRRIHDREGAERRRLHWAAVALGPPFLMLFALGQMTGVCFAAYCAGRFLLERHPRLAGVCFALIAIKPHLVVLALPALLAGGPAALVAFALVLLAWPLGSLLTHGPEGLADFARQIDRVRDTGDGLLGVALSDLLPLAGGAQTLARAAGVAVCLALLATLWLRRRRGAPIGSAELDAATALLLAMLPYARFYDLLFAIPLMLRVGVRGGDRTWPLLTGWWLLPFAGLILLPHGGAGLPALLVPAALVTWWLERVRSHSRDKDHGPPRHATHFSLRSLMVAPKLFAMQTAHRDQRGVALTEFAFAAPIFFFMLMASFQFALIAMQSYSVRHVTRETARWLAIHPDTTDSGVTARARALAMPAMRSAGFVRVTATPACPSLSGGRCLGRSPGDVITVEIEYDVSESVFLPTTFGLGDMSVTFPTRLDPFRVSVLVE